MTESSDERPPEIDVAESWDETIEGRSTRERLYEVVTTLTDPAKVATIAERADCSANGARQTLEWFAELGIVDRVGTDPVLYRRNEAYFEFLRANRLRQEHSQEQLASLIDEYERREQELASQFTVDTPDEVDPLAISTDTEFETEYDQLSKWRATRRRLQDLRRAQLLADRGDSSGAVPV